MWVSKLFVSSAVVALAIWLPVVFSTFSSTGTLTLTIPTLTAGTGTALTTTQIAAIAGGLGDVLFKLENNVNKFQIPIQGLLLLLG